MAAVTIPAKMEATRHRSRLDATMPMKIRETTALRHRASACCLGEHVAAESRIQNVAGLGMAAELDNCAARVGPADTVVASDDMAVDVGHVMGLTRSSQMQQCLSP